MDPELAQLVRDEIGRLKSSNGRSLFAHNLAEAESLFGYDRDHLSGEDLAWLT
jgi:hypothetical protein